MRSCDVLVQTERDDHRISKNDNARLRCVLFTRVCMYLKLCCFIPIRFYYANVQMSRDVAVRQRTI